MIIKTALRTGIPVLISLKTDGTWTILDENGIRLPECQITEEEEEELWETVQKYKEGGKEVN